MDPRSTARILLAEDNTDQVELTLAALEEACVLNPVDVVRDGVEVLDYLLCRDAFSGRAAEPPVLILMDVNMPRVDGIEALGQIKQHPQLRTVPVVMLTGSQHDADRLRSYGVGANAYVVKPVDGQAFFTAVRSISIFWLLSNSPP